MNRTADTTRKSAGLQLRKHRFYLFRVLRTLARISHSALRHRHTPQLNERLALLKHITKYYKLCDQLSKANRPGDRQHGF